MFLVEVTRDPGLPSFLLLEGSESEFPHVYRRRYSGCRQMEASAPSLTEAVLLSRPFFAEEQHTGTAEGHPHKFIHIPRARSDKGKTYVMKCTHLFSPAYLP